MKSTFSIRFRGKESNSYLNKFPKLIKVLLTTSYFNIEKYRNRLFQVFYQSLQLRALVSYSTRIDDVPEGYFSSMRNVALIFLGVVLSMMNVCHHPYGQFVMLLLTMLNKYLKLLVLGLVLIPWRDVSKSTR